MKQGYLAFVLHAHLPFVRDVQHEDALEQNWLFEAITETYVPLCLVLEDLIRDGVDFRLTLSVTPTLEAMLEDPLLQSRYAARLDRLIELSDREVARTQLEPAFQAVARMYRARFMQVRDAFVNRYGMNLLQAFRRFQDLGQLEILASAATHAYLPLQAVNPSVVRAQVAIGVESYRQTFGRRPNGFWLPECGFFPGMDAFLREEQIRYTILETHGITRANERPRYGVYAPVYCPSGVAAFGRDPESSRQVWSSEEGYPGDFDYREFYRDIGHDLDLDYIRPYVHSDGVRMDTGLKYYRVTGKGNKKEPYVPEWAERKAESHAAHFVAARAAQIEHLAGMMDRKPIIVAPYDAELFGHWWFEGPRWLEYVIRKITLEQDVVQLVTLSEYLDEYPINQTTMPCMSSWGFNGFNQVWLNERTHWIYPRLHDAAERMDALVSSPLPDAGGTVARALNQAARELLLAQASDWAFMINSGTMAEYARRRIEEHLQRFHHLEGEIKNGALNEESLAQVEDQDRIFPDVSTASHFRTPEPAHPGAASDVPAEAGRREIRRVKAAHPFHVAMVCPEIAGFAKTGGLADMVQSLGTALEQLGERVSLIMPAYRQALQQNVGLRDSGVRVSAFIAGRKEEAQVLTATAGRNIQVYLIRADRYFDRPYLYGTPEGDYPDNAERFAFFNRASLEVLRELNPPPDILHAHDWQAALSIVFLKSQPERYPGFANARTVLTVHNLGYQGVFPPAKWQALDLDWSLFSSRWLEFYAKINFLKGGFTFADAITTVSPTYAREIRTAEYGFGLEGILNERAADLAGILNGADYEVWDPGSDPFLVQNYTLDDLSGKRACKADVQRIFGLDAAPDVPLIGIVSRLAAQKGIDLIQQALERLMQKNLQLVLLGAGDRPYQEFFESAARNHRDKLGARIEFEEPLAHKIEAGADLFLMPSRYEPSGLNQLYSMKYGTIPVVRATGGLKDSVEEFDTVAGTGVGFVFQRYDAGALLDAVDRALGLFQRKDEWKKLMKNAMTADFSWNRSAREYVQLYEKLLS